MQINSDTFYSEQPKPNVVAATSTVSTVNIVHKA